MRAAIRLVGAEAEAAGNELTTELLAIDDTAPDVAISLTRHGVDPIAVVGLVLGGISTADVVWKWWSGYRRSGLRMFIAEDDGSEQELTGTGEDAFKRRLEVQKERGDHPEAQA